MKILLDFGIGIPSHWIWLALTVLFAVIEGLTLGLTTIWFALGALVMIFISFLPIPLVFQIMIFLAISTAFLIFTRPLALKKFKTGKEKTNVDSLIGKNALVTKKITEFEKGEIKLSGQIWSARAEESAILEEGAKCTVIRIEGVQAIVKAFEEKIEN